MTADVEVDAVPVTAPIRVVDRADAAGVLAAYWRGRKIPLDVQQLAARSMEVLADAGLLVGIAAAPVPAPDPTLSVPAAAGTLRAAADGRRADAAREVGPVRDNATRRARLHADAAVLEQAAQVIEGDLRPLFGWLPPDRWTPAMDAAAAAGVLAPPG